MDIELYKPSDRNFALDDDYIIQRKYDGNRIFSHGTNIFSHRTSKVTGGKISYDDKFPHICQELTDLDLPNDTVLDGELILRGKDYLEDFATLSGLSHSARAYQRQANMNKFAEWIVFDIHYFEGEYLEDIPYDEKMEVLDWLIKGTTYIRLPEQVSLPPRDALEHATSLGWEGIVLRTPDCKTGVVEGDGSPPRPRGCYKWKPTLEADVLVVDFYFGQGKYEDLVGSLQCYAKRGDWLVEFCNCSGMTDLQRHEFLDADYPFVATLEFDSLSPKGKALKPRFKKIHEDKAPEDILDLSKDSIRDVMKTRMEMDL